MSIRKVLERKPIGEVDDDTIIIMADMARAGRPVRDWSGTEKEKSHGRGQR